MSDKQRRYVALFADIGGIFVVLYCIIYVFVWLCTRKSYAAFLRREKGLDSSDETSSKEQEQPSSQTEEELDVIELADSQRIPLNHPSLRLDLPEGDGKYVHLETPEQEDFSTGELIRQSNKSPNIEKASALKT